MEELSPRIVVIGVGGAGGNAVGNMIRNQVGGVEFVAANTDAQALRSSSADRIVQLGRGTTEGLGAGSRAEIGRAAAEESIDDIERVLTGAHMCFIAAGLGGGTGTGAAPVIARVARQLGILTIGVVTRPFAFEGKRRARTADLGLEELQQPVDTLIVIPNQNLFRIANPDTTFRAAFDLADEVLQQGVRGITDLMTMPGLINLDFADIRTIMANRGKAVMGSGEASGDNRAIRAAE
ncbi:MAG: cell division protein FtsZ, partial [Allosphingosinicella sp.]